MQGHKIEWAMLEREIDGFATVWLKDEPSLTVWQPWGRRAPVQQQLARSNRASSLDHKLLRRAVAML